MKQSPHQQDDGEPDIYPTVFDDATDAAGAAELAEAERAVARNGGTAAQRAGVSRAGGARRAEERVEQWQAER